MSGRNPPSYCTLTLIAMQGHIQKGRQNNTSSNNKDKSNTIIETSTAEDHHDENLHNPETAQDAFIHLEVYEDQWAITQGSKRQARWVWSPRTMSGLRLLRLNRLFIPEVKALNDAVVAYKAAAARCKVKVMEMEEATAGTPVILTL